MSTHVQLQAHHRRCTLQLCRMCGTESLKALLIDAGNAFVSVSLFSELLLDSEALGEAGSSSAAWGS